MKSLLVFNQRIRMWMAIVVPLLVIALACGPGEEPTPIPTATPTPTVVTAPTPTLTTAPKTVVATPTPTVVATPSPTSAKQPRRGGTLNFVESSTPLSFDSYLVYGLPSAAWYLGKVNNNLFVNYSGDKIECEICSEAGWRLEDGGKTMVFNIKPGIKFQSGKEMTSADVAYSLRMMMGQIDGFVSARVGVIKEYIDRIETPSKYELRIKLARPSGFVPRILSTTFAVIFEEGVTRDDFKVEAFLRSPKGSGPFLIEEFVDGGGVTYKRNPNYFKSDLPYLDRVEFTVAADIGTRFAAFFTQKTQYYAFQDEPAPQFLDTILKLTDEGKLITKQQTNGFWYHGAWMVASKPPFNDIKVRQAVNLAMDRVELGIGTYGNRYKEQLMVYYPGEDFGTPKEKIWNVVPGWGTGAKKQQEIEQAKQLVKDAGYANGLDVRQFRVSAASTEWAAGHEILQSQLKKVGIRTTFDIAKSGPDFAARLANYDYQIQWYVFLLITADPDEVIGTYQITGGSRNTTGYSNPEVDKLYVLMSSETDSAKRKQIFLQIQDIVLKDAWYAPAAVHNGIMTHWPTIHGVELGITTVAHSGLARGDRIWLEQ